MATILPYKEISENLDIRNSSKKALIDTCTLISFSIDVHEFHDETFDLFETLMKHKFNIYTNVITRSEFIDYQRRVIITEALTSLSQQIPGILIHHELAKRLKSHRAYVQRRADEENPLVLNDTDIKQFKKILSFKHKTIENVWLKFCEDNLSDKLQRTFDLISKTLKFNYLSLRKENLSPEVVRNVDWNKMYGVSERTGMSVNDSMIYHMLECTNIPILITADFDLIYASALSREPKLIFCPQKIFNEYKKIFEIAS